MAYPKHIYKVGDILKMSPDHWLGAYVTIMNVGVNANGVPYYIIADVDKQEYRRSADYLQDPNYARLVTGKELITVKILYT